MSTNVTNTKELANFMKEAGADPHHYSIYPDDNFFYDTVCYICLKNNGMWEIGTRERGTDYRVRRFTTEAEACQKFLKVLYPELLNKND